MIEKEAITRPELAYLVRFFLAVQGQIGKAHDIGKLLHPGEDRPHSYEPLIERGLLRPCASTTGALTSAGFRYLMALELEQVMQLSPKPPAKALEEYIQKGLEGKA